jgi:predicted ferric reductase
MANSISNRADVDSLEPTVSVTTVSLILVTTGIGTIGALWVLQSGLAGLSESLLGPQPKAFWELARSSGLVAYWLMWMSVAFGLLITNRMARLWLGGPTVFDLHQFTSLLGVAFALVHAFILLGDRYIKYSPLQIVLPFASVNYQPVWVGMGQIAFYILMPVIFSFYARQRIGAGTWRLIHGASFLAFSLITVHGLLAGSDTTNFAVLGMYALTGLSVVFLTIYRLATLALAPA